MRFSAPEVLFPNVSGGIQSILDRVYEPGVSNSVFFYINIWIFNSTFSFTTIGVSLDRLVKCNVE